MKIKKPNKYLFLKHDGKKGRKKSDCLLNATSADGKYIEKFVEGRNVVIQQVTKKPNSEYEIRRYMNFESSDDYFDYFKNIQHECREQVLENDARKPAFDIDGCPDPENQEEFFQRCIELIEKVFRESYGKTDLDWVILDSSTVDPSLVPKGEHYEDKFSRHMVINNLLFYDSSEAIHFNNLLRSLCTKPENSDVKLYIDFGLVSKNYSLRTVHSVKNGRKLKIISGHDESESLITVFGFEDSHLLKRIAQPKKPEHVSDLKLNFNINDEHKRIIEEDIGDSFAINSRSSEYGNLVSCDRISPSFCDFCGRVHDKIRIYYTVFDNAIYKFCHHHSKETPLKRMIWKGSNKIKSEIRNPFYTGKFRDYIKLTDKLHDNMDEINQYIRNNIVFLIKGGDSSYLTRNFNNDRVVFTPVSTIKVDASFTVNKEKNGVIVQTTIKLAEAINDIRNEIAYDDSICAMFLKEDVVFGEHELLFNTFIGFRFPYIPNFKVDKSKFKLMDDHIRYVIADGNEREYKYLIGWLAHMLQFPEIKMGIATVLMSDAEGAGKGILTNFIMYSVIGETYCIHLSSTEELTAKFNTRLLYKLFITCDEMPDWTHNNKLSSLLKTMVTNERINIEAKGGDPITIKNYANFAMLTNESKPVHISATDRRFFALKLSNAKARNGTYFRNLLAMCDDKDAAEHFTRWLYDYDLSDFNQFDIPKTEFKKDIQMESILDSASSPTKFLIDIVMNKTHIPIHNDKVLMPITEFYEFYDTWIKRTNNGVVFSSNKFSSHIKKIVTVRRIKYNGSDKKITVVDGTINEISEGIVAVLNIPSIDVLM